jgi:hypothetical protein
MKILPLLLAFAFAFPNLYSQTRADYRIETFASAADGAHTPFWTTNHRWGMPDLRANNAYLRAGLEYESALSDELSYQLGVDLATGAPSVYGSLWFQQLYGRLSWKLWRVDLGAREDYVSLLDPEMSSGDMVFSNHARPVPEIKLSMNRYFLVPRTKGVFFIKGDVAFGRYLDGKWQEETALPYRQTYIKNTLHHHKALYFRFGNIEAAGKSQLNFVFTHYVQWGGALYQRFTNQEYTFFQHPRTLSELIRIMVAGHGSPSTTYTDRTNIAGSHWGSFLLRHDYRPRPDREFRLYYLHFFEDGSTMNPLTFMDMLAGIQYRRTTPALLTGALFEYVYTKNQAGSIHFVLQEEEHAYLGRLETGNDDYYHNADYIQGPSYYGRSFGTPLFLSPGYNEDGRLNFKNNRIIAFHAAVEGYLHPQLRYRLLATVGRGWGRYYRPFLHPQDGIATQLELIYSLPSSPDWEIRLAAGLDRGAFFGGNTTGAGLTITKRGEICGR